MDIEFEKEQAYFTGNSVYLELQTFSGPMVTASPHIHSALEIIVAVEGSFDFYAGGKVFEGQPGDVLLVRSNTIHHFSCKSEGSAAYWVLKIKPSLITEIAATDQCGEYLMFFAINRAVDKCYWRAGEIHGTPLQTAVETLVSEAQRKAYASDIGIRLAAAGILLAIMRQAHQEAPPSAVQLDESVTRRIYDAVVFINQNYNINISAQDCSKIACMSYSYFSRTFRVVTGKNFKEYLNQVRIAHAEKALLTSDKSVTEVAAHCGYDNVSYFISVYKRIKGVTPHITAGRKRAFKEAGESKA